MRGSDLIKTKTDCSRHIYCKVGIKCSHQKLLSRSPKKKELGDIWTFISWGVTSAPKTTAGMASDNQYLAVFIPRWLNSRHILVPSGQNARHSPFLSFFFLLTVPTKTYILWFYYTSLQVKNSNGNRRCALSPQLDATPCGASCALLGIFRTRHKSCFRDFFRLNMLINYCTDDKQTTWENDIAHSL